MSGGITDQDIHFSFLNLLDGRSSYLFPIYSFIFCIRLLKANRPAEAMAVISALEDKPPSDENVQRTFSAIREAVLIEELGQDRGGVAQKTGRASLRELFTGGRSQNFRRVFLGVAIQCFQQVTLATLSINPSKKVHTCR